MPSSAVRRGIPESFASLRGRGPPRQAAAARVDEGGESSLLSPFSDRSQVALFLKLRPAYVLHALHDALSSSDGVLSVSAEGQDVTAGLRTSVQTWMNNDVLTEVVSLDRSLQSAAAWQGAWSQLLQQGLRKLAAGRLPPADAVAILETVRSKSLASGLTAPVHSAPSPVKLEPASPLKSAREDALADLADMPGPKHTARSTQTRVT